MWLYKHPRVMGATIGISFLLAVVCISLFAVFSLGVLIYENWSTDTTIVGVGLLTYILIISGKQSMVWLRDKSSEIEKVYYEKALRGDQNAIASLRFFDLFRDFINSVPIASLAGPLVAIIFISIQESAGIPFNFHESRELASILFVGSFGSAFLIIFSYFARKTFRKERGYYLNKIKHLTEEMDEDLFHKDSETRPPTDSAAS